MCSIASVLLTFAFRNAHLVPSLNCLLACFHDVLFADGLFGLADKLVELIQAHVVVVVAISETEGPEHLFEAQVLVVISIENAEKSLGHALLGEALSGDSASPSASLVSALGSLVVTITVSLIVAIPSGSRVTIASIGVSSSIGSESAAAKAVILEVVLVIVVDFIFFVADLVLSLHVGLVLAFELILVSHSEPGFLIVNVLVFVSATIASVAFLILIPVLASAVFTGIWLFLGVFSIVLVLLLGLSLGFSSRSDSTEDSDLTVHGLQELVLLEVVVGVGVHLIKGCCDFCRLNVAVSIGVEETEDAACISNFSLSLEVSVASFEVRSELFLDEEVSSGEGCGHGSSHEGG